MQRVRTVIFCACLAMPVSTGAIITRHDVPDVQYLARLEDYPELAHVLDQVEGTLIAPQWVLTAAHAVENVDPYSRWSATIAGRPRAIAKIILHPRRLPGSVDPPFDIALLKLEQPIAEVAPAPLYRWDDEALQVASIVGRGKSKTALRSQGEPRDDGKLRRATNKIQFALEHTLVATLDAPPDATGLEGSPGPRDSGGPAYLSRDGRRYVAGVASASSKPGEEGGVYGVTDAYARVSAHRSWIESTMAADPPSTMAVWSRDLPLKAARALPPGDAASIAREFLSAYGRPGAMAAFMRDHGRRTGTATIEQRVAFWDERFAEWGPIELESYRTASSGEIVVRGWSRRSRRWIGFWFTPDPADPGRLASLVAAPVHAPEETSRR